MVATAVNLNDLDGHSPLADVFKCNPSNICAAFYTISTDSVLTWFLCIRRASCKQCVVNNKQSTDCDAQMASTCLFTPTFCRRATVTLKVGQTDLLFGMRLGFISRSVHARL